MKLFRAIPKILDTTIGWRFINKNIEKQYGADPMIETAKNIALDYNINRAGQYLFAYRSQEKAAFAQNNGLFTREIIPVAMPRHKIDPGNYPLGGAIALGHLLGMSGARIVGSAVNQLQRSISKIALFTMCIGVGQGIAIVIEEV